LTRTILIRDLRPTAPSQALTQTSKRAKKRLTPVHTRNIIIRKPNSSKDNSKVRVCFFNPKDNKKISRVTISIFIDPKTDVNYTNPKRIKKEKYSAEKNCDAPRKGCSTGQEPR